MSRDESSKQKIQVPDKFHSCRAYYYMIEFVTTINHIPQVSATTTTRHSFNLYNNNKNTHKCTFTYIHMHTITFTYASPSCSLSPENVSLTSFRNTYIVFLYAFRIQILAIYICGCSITPKGYYKLPFLLFQSK